MRTITTQYHSRNENQRTERAGRRFNVLAEHEGLFKRELNALASMRQLTETLGDKPCWIRFDKSYLIYQAQFIRVRRHNSLLGTVGSALRVAIVFAAPLWMSGWLAKLWSIKQRPSEQAAAPTVDS